MLIMSLSCASSYAAQTSDADSPSVLIAEEDFLSELISAKINLADRCCKRGGFSGIRDDSPTYWENRLTKNYSLSHPNARYNINAASACIEASREADCTPAKTEPVRIPACEEVYRRGSTKVGEACLSSFDCAQPSGQNIQCIITSSEDSYGKCRYVRKVGEGQDCDNSDSTIYQTCSLDLLCDFDRRCVVRAERGKACLNGPLWGDTCAVGSLCDRRDSHRCIAPTPVGQACATIEQCEYLMCYDGKCQEPLLEVGATMCK